MAKHSNNKHVLSSGKSKFYYPKIAQESIESFKMFTEASMRINLIEMGRRNMLSQAKMHAYVFK